MAGALENGWLRMFVLTAAAARAHTLPTAPTAPFSPHVSWHHDFILNPSE